MIAHLSPAPERRHREQLMTPQEVAELFKVVPKTVSQWAQKGRLVSVRTPGGHYRFHPDDVDELLAAGDLPAAQPHEPEGAPPS